MEREEIIQKAREKYINSGITMNITEALRLYLAHDATPEEQIPLFVTSPATHKIKTLLETNRPKCDDCGAGLFMQIDVRDVNGTLYPTAWVCNACGRIEYSDWTQEQWLRVLQNENRG
jgi:ribosomal protein S27AE